ncbi:transcriptional regulator [Halolactibacillus miurensis]|uniref:Helix-turn-helix domain-containing protein n=1 Tax=Halolactibacillus miurensis TaxID=306541 RepID=A0A1I6UTF7_9BACI|nr:MULTISPECIES: helix-turn-helix transcriptional regulator [Halolactibacillus]GEM05622.1 transcriptional regulator [Halolactibacillus miurensis]SFT04680.1 Helix-turn-helix domain-containing protein [Halolactibacillus miurensis]
MNIGERIIKLREKRGWSQRELSRRIDINVSVMNRIESGERPVKDQELLKLSNVLEVSTDYLLGKEDSENDNLFFFDMDGLTPEEIEDIKEHIEYVKWKSGQREK